MGQGNVVSSSQFVLGGYVGESANASCSGGLQWGWKVMQTYLGIKIFFRGRDEQKTTDQFGGIRFSGGSIKTLN